MTYRMNCDCGDVLSVEAATREEAIAKMKSLTTKEAVADHMKKNHPGEKVPSLDETYRWIEKELKAA